MKALIFGVIVGLGAGYLSLFMFKTTIYIASLIAVIYLLAGIPTKAGSNLRKYSFWFSLGLAPSIWIVLLATR
jgi:hypothetical protein